MNAGSLQAIPHNRSISLAALVKRSFMIAQLRVIPAGLCMPEDRERFHSALILVQLIVARMESLDPT